jgi:hypothetical protein
MSKQELNKNNNNLNEIEEGEIINDEINSSSENKKTVN